MVAAVIAQFIARGDLCTDHASVGDCAISDQTENGASMHRCKYGENASSEPRGAVVEGEINRRPTARSHPEPCQRRVMARAVPSPGARRWRARQSVATPASEVADS